MVHVYQSLFRNDFSFNDFCSENDEDDCNVASKDSVEEKDTVEVAQQVVVTAPLIDEDNQITFQDLVST